MHANQGPVKAFSSKSHVQTARESHDLSMDLRLQTASRNEFPCKKSGLSILMHGVISLLEAR